MSKIIPTLALVLTVPLALIYWPSACASQAPHRPAATPIGAESPAELQTVAASPQGVLPHPAFAMAQPAASGAATIADIAERVTPSVVNIASERIVKGPNIPHFFFGPMAPRERKQQGLGSGVVVSEDGVILTNNHVVEEATDITVTLADDREFQAEIVGTDAKSDLAVLRLKGKVEGLQPITFGDSSNLRLGDIVLAIGNPFGVGQTVTMGIVSAVGRANVGIVDYEDFIQTDAAINPGNSGGALVNMRGELIGVNTAILSRTGGYQGIGFAIPTKMAQPIMQALLKDGRVVRGFLGVGIQDLNPELAAMMKVATTQGVLITDVQQATPAAKAGLKRGDVITAVDGVATGSTGRLRNVIAAKGGGATVTLDIVRDGKTLQVPVELGTQQEEQSTSQSKEKSAEPETFGMQLAPLDAALRRRLELDPSAEGQVVIAGVNRGSPAAEAGLRPGEILLEINRQRVTGVAQAAQLLRQSQGKILLLLSSGRGGTRYVVLER